MPYSQEVADKICRGLASGSGSLRAICSQVGISHCAFLDWVRESPELANQYAHAREIGRGLRFERLTEVAASEPERDEKGRIDPGWVAWKRMFIDTEKWSLAREDAKKYGDKLAVGGADDLPAVQTTLDVTGLSTQALAEIMKARDAAERG